MERKKKSKLILTFSILRILNVILVFDQQEVRGENSGIRFQSVM